jgi:enterobacterial common antigen flippase
MSVASLRSPESGSKHSSTYAQILRSSALVGGASALNLIIGIARTKVLALLLGPSGIGLLGVLTSVFDLARSVAQLGLHGSGVRQIAEAVGTNDAQRIARTVTVLRRLAIVLGLLGTLASIVLSGHVAQWAFGDDQHGAAVAWLSLAVFFRLVADGQAALLQGMRRIGDLARVGVFGSLAGAVASIAFAAWLGEAGVVHGMIATAALAALISWWSARTIQVAPVRMTGGEVRAEAVSLLTLGLAFAASGLLMAGAAFAVRAIVSRQLGLDAAGLYQAAWTIGGMYVGFVLQAMGTDFYPRLVGVIDQRAHANRIVNEQAQVSLLLAGPGVVATLVFAEPVLHAFYSSDFAAAGEALRWICLGMALRVITWPAGYIIVARNQRLVFFGAELAWAVVNVGLSWACVRAFGLAGAGIAFFGSYVFHAVLVFWVARRIQGFAWSLTTFRLGALYVAAAGLTFAAAQYLSPVWATAAGVLLMAGTIVHSLRALARLAPELLPAGLRRRLPFVAGHSEAER